MTKPLHVDADRSGAESKLRLEEAWEAIPQDPDRSEALCADVGRRLDAAPDDGLRLRLLRVLSELRFQQGRLPEALEAAEAARALASHEDWPLHERAVLANAGRAQNLMGHYPEALACFQRLLDDARQAADPAWQASMLNNMALVFCGIGDYEQARLHFDGALELYESTGDARGQAYIYNNLSMHPAINGRESDAVGWARLALERIREAGDASAELDVLDTLGGLLVSAGELEEARPLLENAIDRSRSMGIERVRLPASVNFVNLLIESGEFEAAESLSEELLPALEKLEMGPQLVRLRHLRATLFERAGRLADALMESRRHMELRERLHGAERHRRFNHLKAVYERSAERREAEVLKRRAAELEALVRVGREISSSLEPAAVFQRIVDFALELLQGTDSAIFLRSEDGSSLRSSAVAGENQASFRDLVVPMNASLAGSICTSGVAEVVNQPELDSRLYFIDDDPHRRAISQGVPGPKGIAILAAPLRRDRTPVGAILVWKDKKRQGEFAEEHKTFLEALAQQASIAIQNAQLFSELRQAKDAAEGALAQVKTLRGLVPICSSCKNIRDDEGYWHNVADYMHQHTAAEFSHGICPDCIRKLYPDLAVPED